MENFSESRRGRPRKISAAHEELYQDVFKELTTKRSLNNMHYLWSAYNALGKGKDPRYAYLIDRIGESHRWRKTILTALGRLGDQCDDERDATDWICTTADYICTYHLKTADALEHVREQRELEQWEVPIHADG